MESESDPEHVDAPAHIADEKNKWLTDEAAKLTTFCDATLYTDTSKEKIPRGCKSKAFILNKTTQAPIVKRFVNCTGTQRGILLYQAPGAGKTMVGLAWLNNFPPHFTRTVLCPKGLELSFEDDVKKINMRPSDLLRINFLAYQNMTSMSVEDLMPYFNNAVVVADEAHYLLPLLRGPNALAIRSALQKMFRVMLMTGTPIQNDMSDIAVLLNVCARAIIMPGTPMRFTQQYSHSSTIGAYRLNKVIPSIQSLLRSIQLCSLGSILGIAGMAVTGMSLPILGGPLLAVGAVNCASAGAAAFVMDTALTYRTIGLKQLDITNVARDAGPWISYFNPMISILEDPKDLREYPLMQMRTQTVPFTAAQQVMRSAVFLPTFREDRELLSMLSDATPQLVNASILSGVDWTDATTESNLNDENILLQARAVGNVDVSIKLYRANRMMTPIPMVFPTDNKLPMTLQHAGNQPYTKYRVSNVVNSEDNLLLSKYLETIPETDMGVFWTPKFRAAVELCTRARRKTAYLPVVYSNYDAEGLQLFSAYLTGQQLPHIVLVPTDSAYDILFKIANMPHRKYGVDKNHSGPHIRPLHQITSDHAITEATLNTIGNSSDVLQEVGRQSFTVLPEPKLREAVNDSQVGTATKIKAELDGIHAIAQDLSSHRKKHHPARTDASIPAVTTPAAPITDATAPALDAKALALKAKEEALDEEIRMIARATVKLPPTYTSTFLNYADVGVVKTNGERKELVGSPLQADIDERDSQSKEYNALLDLYRQNIDITHSKAQEAALRWLMKTCDSKVEVNGRDWDPSIDEAPFCVLLHPSLKEGLSFTQAPLMVLLEEPQGAGNEEQIRGRVLRKVGTVMARSIAFVEGSLRPPPYDDSNGVPLVGGYALGGRQQRVQEATMWAQQAAERASLHGGAVPTPTVWRVVKQIVKLHSGLGQRLYQLPTWMVAVSRGVLPTHVPMCTILGDNLFQKYSAALVMVPKGDAFEDIGTEKVVRGAPFDSLIHIAELAYSAYDNNIRRIASFVGYAFPRSLQVQNIRRWMTDDKDIDGLYEYLTKHGRGLKYDTPMQADELLETANTMDAVRINELGVLLAKRAEEDIQCFKPKESPAAKKGDDIPYAGVDTYIITPGTAELSEKLAGATLWSPVSWTDQSALETNEKSAYFILARYAETEMKLNISDGFLAGFKKPSV